MDKSKCFYCDKAADLSLPTLIPHCHEHWQSEHPNVKARQEAGYRSKLAFDEAVAAQVQRLRENRLI